MPAFTFQKEFLHIVQNRLVPQVKTGGTTQLALAYPPLAPPAGVGVQWHDIPLLNDQEAERVHGHNNFIRWMEAGLHASRYPLLGYVLDGEVDLRMGVTSSMMKGLRHEVPGGRYLLTLPPGTFFLVPAGVPHTNGRVPHWERPGLEEVDSRILWMYIVPTGAICHTCYTKGLEHDIHYPPLFIRDPALHTQLEWLIAELTTRRHLFAQVAQCHLLSFLLHLERGASGSRPLHVNDAMNLFAGEEGAAVSTHSRDLAFHRACEYIETHLSELLSPALIAKNTFISLSHLTRLFHREAQMPVMQWVWQRRIEMAQKLLRQTSLPVGEISRLVGFQHQSHFSQVFTRNVGVSPLAFRKDAGARTAR